MASLWKSFACPVSELNLNIVLACGQSFRWLTTSDNEWIGVSGRRLWLLKQADDLILFKSYAANNPKVELNSANNDGGIDTQQREEVASQQPLLQSNESNEIGLANDEEEEYLKDYFQLNIKLENLYRQWSNADKNFNALSTRFGGVRILRQDPIENLFSFICSQNNHITRISSLVEKLCVNYGDEICELEGKKYHAFPSLLALSGDKVEGELRELGFGYRAKFINQCAKQILTNHSTEWLYELRDIPYKVAHKALCELPGVGAKVADCVCLMSLDKAEAIPVDTHMWQIAQRDYMPHLKRCKTLTDKIYQEIGDHFRSIYGDFAGWAHSVLFSADLRKFKSLKEAAKMSSSPDEKPSLTNSENGIKVESNESFHNVSPNKIARKRKSQRLLKNTDCIKHKK